MKDAFAGFLRTLFTEYRSAIAADVLYEELKRMNAVERTRDGIAGADIPRRVFDELYSSPGRVPNATVHLAQRPKTSAIEPATAA